MIGGVSGRVAVVLFNLGGPDSLDAVQPFLFNLFNDPAIIGAPQPIRWLLARLISQRRAPVAREIYHQLGGKSPLLDLTRAQAEALEQALLDRGVEAQTFVSMRYWHPRSDSVVADVAAFAPDQVVLLPLYPQYSRTTSGSSIEDWRRAASQAGLNGIEATVCCYPVEAGLVTAQVQLIDEQLQQLDGKDETRPRILFSAHGLPERVIRAGDPYQWQVERTTEKVMEILVNRHGADAFDHVVCYQSRVGPLKWIGPSTEEEIDRAGRDRVPVVVVPIAFVSEHSETLVELDMEYRARAEAAGVPHYLRVPALGTTFAFIDGLAQVVIDSLQRLPMTAPDGGIRLCPSDFRRCPCQDVANA